MSATIESAAAKGVRWDLSALFSGLADPKIAATWEECHRKADDFAARYRSKVGNKAMTGAELGTALREYEAILTEMSKPQHYANLVFAADTGKPEHGAFMQEQTEKASELRIKLMFFDLELQAADPVYIADCAKDPACSPYAHFLSVRQAYRPHALSETEEVLLEETANTGVRAWMRLHDELTANQKYHYHGPDVAAAVELTMEEVLTKLRDPNRLVRQAAADAFSAGLVNLRRTCTFLYNTLLADKRLEDRLRKYEHPESSRHMANELDKPTVDLVMQLCKERSDIVERYYRVKREALGLDELTHIDRYAPLFETKRTVSWELGKQIVLESFGGFSATLRDRAQEFFDKGWIDAEPREGKTGGAFCSYNTPDTHPVLLQSYLGTLDDVMTLAHEMGHGVHGSLSRAQSYLNFDGSLPLAELASIFGEMLTFERLVGEADDRDRLALYAQKLEGIFASVHRQAAMFRFEQRCHEHRRTKGELSSDDFEAIWQEEIQSMFGDALRLGEQHKLWWQYVGHFVFAPFYVYAYSFGELLALAVYQKAKAEGAGFEQKYVEVLRLGGSQNPFELMAHLGIDLRSREFWQGGFAAIEGLQAEFERLWAAHKS
ncbi:MAG: M3 family oligoendopeptidase [Fimbriimonadaceae bacterium]|nr:M3 family oligoendopeptidase [Fimbriimonadaceae bacterium]QYK56035.1 MAG: M3 family oligoendopeptidase [Fimbriimonadaceae bacterium]